MRHFGTLSGDFEAVARLLLKLRREERELNFVYEAAVGTSFRRRI